MRGDRLPRLIAPASLLLLLGLAACSSGGTQEAASVPPPAHASAQSSPNVPARTSPTMSATPTSTPTLTPTTPPSLPGMPPVLDPHDVYAADRPGALSPVVRGMPSRVYVPNSKSNTVTVIDPATYKVLRTVRVGRQPQHVVPSWDLKTLWVNNDLGNSLTPIDPTSGKLGKPVAVHDPYNLYFTPDGRFALVMASADRQIVVRDAHSMAVKKKIDVPCSGVNHADFSVDGRYFVVSCEFSAELLKVDTESMRVVGDIHLRRGSMPQDVKIAPDGHTFYVADMKANGLWFVDGDGFRVTRFLATGKGTHGIYVSRNSRTLYISNREEGSISLLDVRTDKLIRKWHIRGGGSPDMGGVSADGKVLWLSGRYDGVVYALSTHDGHLLAKIPVGSGPHGLCIYPQPGRYSLGHTGVFR